VEKLEVEVARAIADYAAAEEGELSFREGDAIAVDTIAVREAPSSRDEHWWPGELRGAVGLFPVSYVRIEKACVMIEKGCVTAEKKACDAGGQGLPAERKAAVQTPLAPAVAAVAAEAAAQQEAAKEAAREAAREAAKEAAAARLYQNAKDARRNVERRREDALAKRAEDEAAECTFAPATNVAAHEAWLAREQRRERKEEVRERRAARERRERRRRMQELSAKKAQLQQWQRETGGGGGEGGGGRGRWRGRGGACPSRQQL
jgi:hypothetical protein